ncbi:MAG: aminodeoxychorismate synthase component I [Gammaproteobacteria bacterium]|nr:aminodeoxychorismate synthase component I [Gammaproteobacteria bacterium]MDP2141210.1 aminodeoxychorismate synthase component I [Gammaproteobacteria bacterium]MDP2349116.1 aminodeoxychorismate synthase component I [Gammaproteobacteria bacterium]
MNNTLIKDLPYDRDSAALLRRFAALPGLAFLDSGNGSGENVRYDILSALPDVSITLQDGKVSIHTENATEENLNDFAGDIFAAVDQALSRMAPAQPSLETLAALPFKGGAIGYFGYESVAEVGIYNWAIVVDHQQHHTTLFMLPNCSEATRLRILTTLASETVTPQPFVLRENFRANFSAASYKAAFDKVQDYIQAGDCYQVSLAQRFYARYDGDPLSAYLQLRQKIHSPFAAYMQRSNGALLSFSPERFISVVDGKVTTQPIKGTRPRAADSALDKALAEDLLNSSKDRAENLMIVDLLRNDLGTLCQTGSVKVEKLFELQSFSNVHHLVSTINGTLGDEHSALSLLRNCFPGGSITGAPKKRAMEIIEEVEPDGRKVYCGAVAYVSFDGRMDTNITIRTILCEAPDVFCWGGGGIVADSVWHQEYQECYDKINNIINSLR